MQARTRAQAGSLGLGHPHQPPGVMADLSRIIAAERISSRLLAKPPVPAPQLPASDAGRLAAGLRHRGWAPSWPGCGPAMLVTPPWGTSSARVAAVRDVTRAAPQRRALGEALQRAADVRYLWRGLGTQLARDVPFSALYWGALEPMRTFLHAACGPAEPNARSAGALRAAAVNAAAGGLAGAAAAAVTTPLDVAKTRRQLQDNPLLRRGTLGTLQELVAEGGVRTLFTGVMPRALRAAPSCGLVLAAYEMAKSRIAAG